MQEAIIQTERLILRPWRNEELESFAALYADPRVMEHWVVKTREESIQEFHHLISHMKKYGWGFWAVELKDSHQLIGLTGIENIPFQAHFTPAVEIGWRLHYDYWGKGYATEGAKAALQYGFDQLHLNEIVAYATVANTRSRKVMKKLKMTHDAQDDFDDPHFPIGHHCRRLVLYRLRKQEWQKHKP